MAGHCLRYVSKLAGLMRAEIGVLPLGAHGAWALVRWQRWKIVSHAGVLGWTPKRYRGIRVEQAQVHTRQGVHKVRCMPFTARPHTAGNPRHVRQLAAQLFLLSSSCSRRCKQKTMRADQQPPTRQCTLIRKCRSGEPACPVESPFFDEEPSSLLLASSQPHRESCRQLGIDLLLLGSHHVCSDAPCRRQLPGMVCFCVYLFC